MPTKSFLEIEMFARMSKEISQAHQKKEKADWWLAEMVMSEAKGLFHKTPIQIREALSCLEVSRQLLEGVQEEIGTLRHETATPGSPTLRRLDNVEMLGRKLLCLELVDAGALERVSMALGVGGFAGTLDYFDVRVGSISELTRDLEKRLGMLGPLAERGEVRLVVQENRAGNLLVEFSRLTVAWLKFLQDFNAICLLAAELGYDLEDLGSLTDVAAKSEEARIC